MESISKPKPVPVEIRELFVKYGCSSCHKPQHRHVGPSFYTISQRNYSADQMLELIRNPKQENWPGFTKMTAIPDIKMEEVVQLKKWMDTLEPVE